MVFRMYRHRIPDVSKGVPEVPTQVGGCAEIGNG